MISASDRYICLGSFKKNGEQVNTPLWFTHMNRNLSELYAVTNGNSWKVKRMRNFPDVKIARCTMSGKVLGDWRDARAEFVDGDEAYQQINKAMRGKYGWQLAVADFVERLSGKYNNRLAIKLTINAD